MHAGRTHDDGADGTLREQVALAEEPRNEGVGRPLEEIPRGAFLQQLAVPEDADPVREDERLLLVVRDVQGGDSGLAVDAPELVLQLDAQSGVEAPSGSSMGRTPGSARIAARRTGRARSLSISRAVAAQDGDKARHQ